MKKQISKKSADDVTLSMLDCLIIATLCLFFYYFYSDSLQQICLVYIMNSCAAVVVTIKAVAQLLGRQTNWETVSDRRVGDRLKEMLKRLGDS